MYKAPCCGEWLLTVHFCRALIHMMLSNPMRGDFISFIDDKTLRLRRTLPNARVRNKEHNQDLNLRFGTLFKCSP